MTLYEKDPIDLPSQIEHYKLLRREAVLQYYCRKEGYKQLGLHILPTLVVSENNAKEAIKMMLVLQSLAKSPFADEMWTLRDTSMELFNAAPRNCFKKDGYEVTVWFDDDPENSYPYTNWKSIYYQDETDMWHKTTGRVDENGLYFEDSEKTKVYFTLFQEKADLYSKTGKWTVNIKNEQLSSSVASSARRHLPNLSYENRSPSTSSRDTSNSSQVPTTYRRREESDAEEGPSSTSRSPARRRRRRGEQQGKHSAARPEKRARGGNSAPDPDEVGRNHRSVPESGLSRLARLQAEARDPPILLISGPANPLKCFRYRCFSKNEQNFLQMSTVWHWVTNKEHEHSNKLLVAFKDDKQRNLFLVTTTLPKGCSYCFGYLDCL